MLEPRSARGVVDEHKIEFKSPRTPWLPEALVALVV